MRAFAFLFVTALASACGGRTVDESTASDASADGSADAVVDAAPNLVTCTGPGQCALVPVTCCGTCSVPALADYTAVHERKTAEHFARVCGPEPVACPGCAPMKLDDSLQAWCRFPSGGGGGGRPAGTCTAIDVREEPVSACATDADCVLRHSPCCEPCDEVREDLVALTPSSIEAYRRAVCVGDEACPRCASRYPADARAMCNPTTKHCEVAWVDFGG